MPSTISIYREQKRMFSGRRLLAIQEMTLVGEKWRVVPESNAARTITQISNVIGGIDGRAEFSTSHVPGPVAIHMTSLIHRRSAFCSFGDSFPYHGFFRVGAITFSAHCLYLKPDENVYCLVSFRRRRAR